jgi:hypothetical protein
MIAYLGKQGISFLREQPTNAFLAKICSEKLGLVFNIATPDGVKEMMLRLPDIKSAKIANKHGRRKIIDFYNSAAWKAVRFDVLKANDGRCELCGQGKHSGVTLHVDHILPRSKFPTLELEPTNLQILCEPCNMGKSNRDTTDWRQNVYA